MSMRTITRFVLAGAALTAAMAASPAMADKAIRMLTTERDPNTQAVFNQIVEEFTKLHPDVKIEIEYSGFSDINMKVATSLAAGDPPQIINAQNFFIFEYANNGGIRPLDGLIDDIGREDFVASTLAAYSTPDGVTWGLPFSIGANVLWARGDLYEKYGLEIPKTWDEYEHNNKVLYEAGQKDGQQKMYGLAMAAGINWATEDTTHAWMWNNGALITDAQGNPTLTSPEAVETLAFLKRLSKYAPPGITTYGHNEVINAFVTESVAHTEYPFRVLTNMKRSNPKLLDIAVPFLHPRGPSPKARGATHLYAKGWAILKDADHQEESEAFLKYMLTGDRYIRLLHSVPIHYWPPRYSVQKNTKFRSHPLMQTPAGKRSLDVLDKALQQGVFALNGSGSIVLKLAPLIEKRMLSNALQRVLIQGMSPEDSLREAAKLID